MLKARTQPETLESWKQIAAHLERSERTVRRWEACEGLPVYRRKHQKQDTVFAYTGEIDHWKRRRTRKLAPPDPAFDATSVIGPVADRLQVPLFSSVYLNEHDRITRVIDNYIVGARAGIADLMRPSFHPQATLAGYCGGVEYSGSIEHLFRWIDQNGPAPRIQTRFARIEIFKTMAVVHLEVQGWSGRLAINDSRIAEVFTLIKRNGEWQITQKAFDWHLPGEELET